MFSCVSTSKQSCSVDALGKNMIIKKALQTTQKTLFFNYKYKPLLVTCLVYLQPQKLDFLIRNTVLYLQSYTACNKFWYMKVMKTLMKNLHRVAVLLCALLSVAAANDLWKVMTHHWLRAPMIGVRVVSPPFVEENSRLTLVKTK